MQALNEKLKFMGGTMKSFSKLLLSLEVPTFMVAWVTKFYRKSPKIRQARFPTSLM